MAKKVIAMKGKITRKKKPEIGDVIKIQNVGAGWTASPSPPQRRLLPQSGISPKVDDGANR